jgi:hypothetical protein
MFEFKKKMIDDSISSELFALAALARMKFGGAKNDRHCEKTSTIS